MFYVEFNYRRHKLKIRGQHFVPVGHKSTDNKNIMVNEASTAKGVSSKIKCMAPYKSSYYYYYYQTTLLVEEEED